MHYKPVSVINRLGVFLYAALLLSITGYTSQVSANATDFALRINVGGDAYTDNQGRQWSADTGFNTERVSHTRNVINGTANPVLYQTARWDVENAPGLSYRFALTNGSYQIRLHFADTFNGIAGVGLRLFNVKLEGQAVLSGLDIFAEAGVNAALVKTFTVTVNDGELNIEFLRQVQNPELRGLEIYASKSPVIHPIAAQSITAGHAVFRVVATDPQGAFFFTRSGLFSWNPPMNVDTGESYQVVFRAADALDPELAVERTAYISVAENAPQLELVQDATVREGETLELALNAATVNGHAELSAIFFDAPLTSLLTARGAEARFEQAGEAGYHDKTGKLIHVQANTPRFLDTAAGHILTSYTHNTASRSKARAPDLLTYNIENFASDLLDNNTMVENEYLPQWDDRELRGGHPRQEDVTLSTGFARGERVSVAVRVQVSEALEISPDFFSDALAVGPGPDPSPTLSARQDQSWGEQLMTGNLTESGSRNFSPL